MDDDAPAGGPKPRLVGINHVALEVGDVDEALAFYGRIFEFTLRGKGEGQAFIDMGDQFIALLEAAAHRDAERHFGLVVDDRWRPCASARRRPAPRSSTGPFSTSSTPGATASRSSPTRDLQFTKAPEVLRAMGLTSRRASGPGASSPAAACSRTAGEAAATRH